MHRTRRPGDILAPIGTAVVAACIGAMAVGAARDGHVWLAVITTAASLCAIALAAQTSIGMPRAVRRQCQGALVAAALPVAPTLGGAKIGAVILHRAIATLATAAIVVAIIAHAVSAPVAVMGAMQIPAASARAVLPSRRAQTPRAPPPPDAVAAHRMAQQARLRRHPEQAAVAKQAEATAGVRRHRIIPPPSRTQLVDFQFARRPDVFGPHSPDATTITEIDGQQYATTTTSIYYLSGKKEGALAFALPLPPDGGDPQIVWLGAWEQLTYYVLCDFYLREGTDADGWLQIPSLYSLVRQVCGRTPTGPDYTRVTTALRHLALTTILDGSEHYTIGWRTVRGHRRRKTQKYVIDRMYHLISDLELTARTNPPAGTTTPQGVRIRLSGVVQERLRSGLVVTLRSAVIRAIGPKNEAALRLYTYICSQRHVDRISAVVVEQIIRPTPSRGLAKKPSKFRAVVERMVQLIAEADASIGLRVVPASKAAGGWNLTWVGQTRKKATKPKNGR